MYICIVCICMYIYICMYTCVYIVCICVCVCVYVCACARACACACVCVYVCMCVCVYVCMYVCMYVSIYIYIHIETLGTQFKSPSMARAAAVVHAPLSLCKGSLEAAVVCRAPRCSLRQPGICLKVEAPCMGYVLRSASCLEIRWPRFEAGRCRTPKAQSWASGEDSVSDS